MTATTAPPWSRSSRWPAYRDRRGGVLRHGAVVAAVRILPRGTAGARPVIKEDS